MRLAPGTSRIALASLLLVAWAPGPCAAEPDAIQPFGLAVVAGQGGATITVTGTIGPDQPDPGKFRIRLQPDSTVTIHPDATGDLPPLGFVHGKPQKSIALPATERSSRSVGAFRVEPAGASAYVITFPPPRPAAPTSWQAPAPPRPPSGPATVRVLPGPGLVLDVPRNASWAPAVSISMDPLPRTYRITLPAGTQIALPMGNLASDARQPALLAWLKRVGPGLFVPPGTTGPARR
jgi:hypothetical protein